MTRLLRTAATAVIGTALAAATLLALAGCDTGSTPPPPTTVVVNTPPADGGMAVLLTVVIGLAVLALIGAAALAVAWSHERRTRREAENTVYALTGRRTAHAVVAVAPDVAQLLALDSTNRTSIERHHR